MNRIFDADCNSFKFDVGELVLLKDTPSPENVGFRTDITYGFSVPEATQSTADTGGGVSILLNWAGGQEAIGNQAAFSNDATNIFDVVLDAALIHDARCNCPPPCTDGRKTVLYREATPNGGASPALSVTTTTNGFPSISEASSSMMKTEPDLFKIKTNKYELLKNLQKVLDAEGIAAINLEIKRNVFELYRLGENHFNFTKSLKR